jgi:hypothetical protein
MKFICLFVMSLPQLVIIPSLAKLAGDAYCINQPIEWWICNSNPYGCYCCKRFKNPIKSWYRVAYLSWTGQLDTSERVIRTFCGECFPLFVQHIENPERFIFTDQGEELK